MSRLRRQLPLAALLLVSILALLAVGLWLGGHPEDLPGFLRSAFVSNEQTRVVDEAIEKVSQDYYRPVKKGSLVTASISGMVSSLKDPYSTYLDPHAFNTFEEPATFTGIGVSIKPEKRGLKVVHVFDESPAQRAGLQIGDVIVKANGTDLEGLPLSKAVDLIKGRPGTVVDLEVLRGGQAKQFQITRETISTPVVASEARTVEGVKLGWVYLATFSEGAHAQVAEAVHSLLKQGAKGLVLDLRGNGGGLVSEAQLIASLFIRSGGVVVTTKGRAQPTVVLKALGGAIPSSIPMVVLVDRATASAAEIVTAALQDHHRAKVVGTHTYGKGVFQELMPLSNGGGLKITVGEYYTPNGRNLGGGGVKEGAGITPEVKVEHGVDTEHGLQVALKTLRGELQGP